MQALGWAAHIQNQVLSKVLKFKIPVDRSFLWQGRLPLEPTEIIFDLKH